MNYNYFEIITALITPYKNNKIDYLSLKKIIEYQIENYDSYYGQGVEIDPGYIYVAKGGDIELFATILGDKSSVIKLYPITKEFAEMHKTLFE